MPDSGDVDYSLPGHGAQICAQTPTKASFQTDACDWLPGTGTMTV